MGFSKRGFLVAGLAIATVSLSPAEASFHFMQIEQVIGGVGGDTTVQAIQLRMRSAGQGQVQFGRLVVRDSAGLNPIVLATFSGPVTNGATGSRVLIASSNFASHTSPPVTPDKIMSALIPPGYLTAGSLTWEDSSGLTIYWRLSWGGAAYTGPGTGATTNDLDGVFNPPFSGPCPTSGTQALQFKFAANAFSTNNANDYQLTTGAAVFTNNAPSSGTVFIPITGACCLTDGVCVVAAGSSDCSSMGGQYKGNSTTCADSDGDGIPDVMETNNCGSGWNRNDLCNTRTNPSLQDSDGDGFLDGEEVYLFGTNPCVVDADCDANGIPDAVQIANGSRPDRNNNGIPDVCEYPPCTTTPGDANGDGLVNGLDIDLWVDCYLGDVSSCRCADMDNDFQFTPADLDHFVTILISTVVGPRCDNCQPVNTTFWECHHWASDNNGAACSTTLCIENIVASASCTFHPDQSGAAMCNANTATGAKFTQRIHKASCPGGTVNWVVGLDLTVGCSACNDNSIYVSCVTGGCTSNLLRGPFNRGSRHVCGCP